MNDKEILENEESKILEAKNLRISFNTINGTVKAVRGISFSLYRGRTLAIVGESGSGKSVTSKAIMGLLAPNKIVEGGQILYDGKDLLKISEEDFSKIRGSKISMIFQDPMSSLNPIMKVGKQVTEAMKLKRKSESRIAKHNCRFLFSSFEKYAKENNYNEFSSGLYSSYSNYKRKNEEFPIERFDEFLSKFLADNIVVVKNNRMDSINKISEFKDCLTKNDEIDFAYFKQYKKNFKKTLDQIQNKFLPNKENIINTFFVALNGNLKTYKQVVKKDKKDKKNENKVLNEKEALKAKAFGSEIKVKPTDVVKIINDSFDELIKFLTDSLKAEVISLDVFKKYLDNNVIDAHLKVSNKEFKERARQVLEEVGIKDAAKRMNQYPFEFSGGMRQRIVIAIALSSNPKILICDEPTTALDVTIQAQILDLINDLKEKRNLSIIFITHNLGVVARMADDVAVMYAGKIVEYGTVDDIFYDPKHPYTWALLSSMPDLDSKDKLDSIPGTPPNMIIPPVGDAFAARNKYAMSIDLKKEPPLFKVTDTHYAATWLLDKNAPKVELPKAVADRINKMKLNELNRQKGEEHE